LHLHVFFVATKRFNIRVFLILGYLPATANKHYQSRFKVFHFVGVEQQFVWPLSAVQYSSTGYGGTQTFLPC